MRNYLSLLGFLTIMLSFCACSDVIEQDVSKEKVSVIAPYNGYKSNTLTVHFTWNALDNARSYRLQVATPNFSLIKELVVDTTLSGTDFIYSFKPGYTYQWRIKAQNNAGDTDYTTYNFTVDSTSNLSGETLVLTNPSPVDGLATQQTKFTFRWIKIATAEEYRFIIKNDNGNTDLDRTITADTLSYTFAEGSYTWKVRGQNGGTNTPYTTRTLIIDRTPPTVSTQTLPVNRDSTANPVVLKWNRDATAIADSVYIYNDSLATTVVTKTYTTETSYSFSGTSKKAYFWRLKSFDAALNASGYSNSGKPFKFIVK